MCTFQVSDSFTPHQLCTEVANLVLCVIALKYQIKELSYSFGIQQIIYYQSINVATCFG